MGIERKLVFLALIRVMGVEGGYSDFNETQLASLILDGLADVFTGGFSCRLQVSRGPGGHDQWAVQLLVLFANLTHFHVLVAHGIGPVPRGALGDVHAF